MRNKNAPVSRPKPEYVDVGWAQAISWEPEAFSTFETRGTENELKFLYERLDFLQTAEDYVRRNPDRSINTDHALQFIGRARSILIDKINLATIIHARAMEAHAKQIQYLHERVTDDSDFKPEYKGKQ